ncbi:MAG: alanine--tRNA ligase [Elusimicrobia bacterium]|nr:alanine--tRNA ligase [Elusimicrobiota bacterium]
MTNAAGAALRRSYLDFFARRGHVVKPSAPLVPQGDATLMFNSAGMVPFKPYFLGLKADLARAASCQKCLRTTDVERVGATLRHLTFFEMLGNFSFGDYFKAEAVAWAWEFLTKEAGLDPKRLHPTVFQEDDEAAALWAKVGCPNPAKKLGEDTNFWNMGPTGPCGPCSEIYYDLGPGFGAGPEDAVGGDGDRYLEIWNLVFTGFDRRPDGSLQKLARPCIDTGMGLERLALAAQGCSSPFATDLFRPITEKAAALIGRDPDDLEFRRALRVIADHSRAAAMLAAEGIIPSNVERGYVLRRLIRRAARYGQSLGRPTPFLHELVPAVVDIFAPDCPELRPAADQIRSILKAEETKFLETLQAGETELAKLLAKAGGTLSGDAAFKLYETYGFPLELTQEICGQKRVAVDEEGFAAAREKAAETARASWRGSGEKNLAAVAAAAPKTEFLGYDALEAKAAVVASAPGLAALDRTPFYAEGGGQIGDSGDLISRDGTKALARVLDTQKQGGVFVHILEGGASIPVGTALIARVDAERRARIKPHHTATHLMNEALKRVLGSHVRQAGSYVGPDKLRFDFTHSKPLTPEEVARIETIVNDEIKAAHPVVPECHPVSKVADFGATTLLGEDYGESPRFLLIGAKGWTDPKNRFSLELCGGTHVGNTAEILAFKIIKEASASAGVRRIEALAGPAVEEDAARRKAARDRALAELKAREKDLLARLRALGAQVEPTESPQPEALKAGLHKLESRLGALKAARLASQAGAAKTVREVKGVTLCAQRLDGADPKSLRGLADKLKAELGSGLVFLAAPGNGRLSFVLAATPDLAAKGVDAARIAKAFAAKSGGSAGGRPDFAQGGAAESAWEEIVRALASSL